uniref:Glucosamine 6-phosphate N-acetyltransferase n=1 Tax=Tetraselmis sp. GSL018 TaxID=582737 RepID=A0A061R1F9_9CHLO
MGKTEREGGAKALLAPHCLGTAACSAWASSPPARIPAVRPPRSAHPTSPAVVSDASEQRVVATATLLVERKFIHGCGKVGHIEDVVVDPGYRGQRLGQRLIEDLVGRAKAGGCYKVILDCSEDNAAFYEKCGLSRKEIQMVLYLDR